MSDFDFGLFGHVEGAIADIDATNRELVVLPDRFGGVARDPEDSRVRVVVGPRGSGKTFLMSRMRAAQLSNASTYASALQTNEDLGTLQVSEFVQKLGLKSGNTEEWTQLWRRAIMCAAWSFISNITELRPSRSSSPVAQEAFRALKSRFLDLLESPETERRVSSRAAHIITRFQSVNELRRYLADDRWEDVENYLARILHETQPLFLYVDDIDKNYAWAPGLWTQCQRGLFYAVFALLKRDTLRNKLHVVIAIRDTTLATISSGEHATRYAEKVHINHLKWTRESISYFLAQKIAQLPESFLKKRSAGCEDWLGLAAVHSARPGSPSEGVESYLVRHTRLLPRDVVYMGNMLCNYMQEQGISSIDEATLREHVSTASRSIVRAELSSLRNEARAGGLAILTDNEDGDTESPDREAFRSRDIDAIVHCVESTGTEVFLPDTLAHLESGLHAHFSSGKNPATGSRVVDLLWQHRLLCWCDTSGATHFFDPEDFFGRAELPRGTEVWRYQWNCMLFDICPSLEVSGDGPAYP